jgi:hypothetical protein
MVFSDKCIFTAIMLALIFGTPMTEVKEKMIRLKDKLMVWMFRGDDFSLPKVKHL